MMNELNSALPSLNTRLNIIGIDSTFTEFNTINDCNSESYKTSCPIKVDGLFSKFIKDATLELTVYVKENEVVNSYLRIFYNHGMLAGSGSNGLTIGIKLQFDYGAGYTFRVFGISI